MHDMHLSPESQPPETPSPGTQSPGTQSPGTQSPGPQPQETWGPEATSSESSDARVVFLVNFLSPNLREVCREIERRVRQFTILVSVPMEGNRQWAPDDAGLDVRVQRTRTVRKVARHRFFCRLTREALATDKFHGIEPCRMAEVNESFPFVLIA